MSSDPSGADAQQQEQMREYVEQLRAAQPEEIVAQAFTMLGTGAEVKLGRPDARVLIDAVSGLVEAVAGQLSDELVSGMRDGVSQLQQAHVQAESQAGAEPAPEAPRGGQPPQPGAEQPSQQGQDESMTERLWVPGRD